MGGLRLWSLVGPTHAVRLHEWGTRLLGWVAWCLGGEQVVRTSCSARRGLPGHVFCLFRMSKSVLVAK